MTTQIKNVKILINRGMDIIFAEAVGDGHVLSLKTDVVAGEGEHYIVACLGAMSYERICGKTGQTHFMKFTWGKDENDRYFFEVDEKATAEALAKKEADNQ